MKNNKLKKLYRYLKKMSLNVEASYLKKIAVRDEDVIDPELSENLFKSKKSLSDFKTQHDKMELAQKVSEYVELEESERGIYLDNNPDFKEYMEDKKDILDMFYQKYSRLKENMSDENVKQAEELLISLDIHPRLFSHYNSFFRRRSRFLESQLMGHEEELKNISRGVIANKLYYFIDKKNEIEYYIKLPEEDKEHYLDNNPEFKDMILKAKNKAGSDGQVLEELNRTLKDISSNVKKILNSYAKFDVGEIKRMISHRTHSGNKNGITIETDNTKDNVEFGRKYLLTFRFPEWSGDILDFINESDPSMYGSIGIELKEDILEYISVPTLEYFPESSAITIHLDTESEALAIIKELDKLNLEYSAEEYDEIFIYGINNLDKLNSMANFIFYVMAPKFSSTSQEVSEMREVGKDYSSGWI